MEDFVTFELVIKLKEKGFREDCIAYYHTDGELLYNRDQYRGGDYKSLLRSYNSLPKNPIGCEQIDAPTIYQVLKWLRKEKKVHIGFGYSPHKKWRYVVMYLDDRFYNKPTLAVDGFLEIEQAALDGIEYVLDNLINIK